MAETIAQRHERQFAEVIPGGRQVLASGAKLERHDVRTEHSDAVGPWDFRYELKATRKKSYSLRLKDWQDLTGYVYARSSNERPAWAVRFYPPEGETAIVDLVLVDLNDWCELLDELGRLKRGG